MDEANSTNYTAPAPMAAPAPSERASQSPSFMHVLLPLILQPLIDLRNRTAPEYRAFFDQLTRDIRERGVQVPVLAYREGEKFRLIDGLTRLHCSIAAGNQESLPALVFSEKPNSSALLVGQLQANAMRHDLTDLEYAAVYLQLMQMNGWKAAELWRRINVAPATGTKRLAISRRLCEQVRNMVAASEVCPRAAYAISRIEEASLQVQLAQDAKNGLLCVEGVEAEVARLLSQGRKKKEKPMILQRDGITMTVPKPTLEIIRAFIDMLIAALKRVKSPDEIRNLQTYLKSI